MELPAALVKNIKEGLEHRSIRSLYVTTPDRLVVERREAAVEQVASYEPPTVLVPTGDMLQEEQRGESLDRVPLRVAVYRQRTERPVQ